MVIVVIVICIVLLAVSLLVPFSQIELDKLLNRFYRDRHVPYTSYRYAHLGLLDNEP